MQDTPTTPYYIGDYRIPFDTWAGGLIGAQVGLGFYGISMELSGIPALGILMGVAAFVLIGYLAVLIVTDVRLSISSIPIPVVRCSLAWFVGAFIETSVLLFMGYLLWEDFIPASTAVALVGTATVAAGIIRGIVYTVTYHHHVE